MVGEEHLKILDQVVKTLIRWREENLAIQLKLDETCTYEKLDEIYQSL